MAVTKRRKQSIETSMAIIRGIEPITTKESFKADLIKALNWYNANWEEKDYRSSAEKYMTKVAKVKDTTYLLSKASFSDIRPIGVIGRLVMRDQYVDLNTLESLLVSIEKLQVKYARPKPAAVTIQSTGQTISVQDRINESARVAAGEVEGAIDDYLINGTEFSMKSFLLSKQVSGVVAKKIGAMFEGVLAELDEAIAGKDVQLKEGYGQYTKRGLKAYAEFMRQIVADCNQQAVSAKAQRKPRARKAKPASVVAKNMVYMKEFPELKLKSITADKIIGASELWVYNTANRKLIVYYGADNGYLGVSGMSVTNYDVEKSSVKTLRDPEKFFKGLASTGKRAMANAWKAVKAKASSPRARINEDMILLAAN